MGKHNSDPENRVVQRIKELIFLNKLFLDYVVQTISIK